MKYFLVIIILAGSASCQNLKHIIGKWYSPNGLIELVLNKDKTFKVYSIDGTSEYGTWIKEFDTIRLSDSTFFALNSGNITYQNHAFTKIKPNVNTQNDLNLNGLRFYRDIEFEGLKKDTLTFSDTTYFSSFSQKYHQYRLLNWNDRLYFTDNNLRNLGDDYILLESIDDKKLVLNYYDNTIPKHIIIEFIKIP